MPTQNKPCGEFFGKRFESAVPGRNPSRAENCDVHFILLQPTPQRSRFGNALNYPLAAFAERAKARADVLVLFAGALTGLYRNQLAI